MGSQESGTTSDQLLSRRGKCPLFPKGMSLQLRITRGSTAEGDYPVRAVDPLEEVWVEVSPLVSAQQTLLSQQTLGCSGANPGDQLCCDAVPVIS